MRRIIVSSTMAGHGVYDYAKTSEVPCSGCGADKIVNRVSGMVIGEDQFLTPAQIAQMRAVPELVFVNCCHLGKIEDVADKLPPNYPPKLAANIASELIRMGVKAVVAAGWEVDDAAARLFATIFYTEILAGAAFGEAVLKARVAVFDAFPKINTWGAYQCYGDHAFRLSQTGAKASATRQYRFAAPAEVITQLDNIVQQAKTADDESMSHLKEDLGNIDQRIPTEWRPLGEILAALGRAYGELHDFTKAVEYYETAVSDEKSPCPVKTVEQLCNLRARRAVEVGKADPAQAAELITKSETQLTALNEVLGETAERLSLLGSTAKREAVVMAGLAGKRKALEKMEAQYRKAYEHGKMCDPYPHSNELTATVLLSLFEVGSTVTKKTLQAIRKERESAANWQQCAPDFWKAVIPTDYLLLNHLAAHDLADHVEEIIAGYEEVKRYFGSPREFRSVIEHLGFLIDIVEVTPAEVKERLCAPLEQVRSRLAAE